ncbi:hypothetical protein K0M31_008334 [Melipona bicolor]|uniref:Uncharacterized protein n=1 Tax=Melipona bicolor TaxID=60889 RepID=A0AA40FRE7_9HYME|nr:hypothetical protein K0M31_008334 [Melipona bicolor]
MFAHWQADIVDTQRDRGESIGMFYIYQQFTYHPLISETTGGGDSSRCALANIASLSLLRSFLHQNVWKQFRLGGKQVFIDREQKSMTNARLANLGRTISGWFRGAGTRTYFTLAYRDPRYHGQIRAPRARNSAAR